MSAKQDEWPVICSYSRADALADGTLVDVSEVARAAKFTVPVAMTTTVWTRCVEVPDGVRNLSQPVRLWNLLAEAHYAIRASWSRVDRISFELVVARPEGGIERVEILALCHGDDNGEPVLTLLFDGEE
jgi:hypothetical protein